MGGREGANRRYVGYYWDVLVDLEEIADEESAHEGIADEDFAHEEILDEEFVHEGLGVAAQMAAHSWVYRHLELVIALDDFLVNQGQGQIVVGERRHGWSGSGVDLDTSHRSVGPRVLE